MAKRGGSKCTSHPEAQSLALSTGTAAAPSMSSKKPPETSTEITRIYCYLGSGISMYGILHRVQRNTRPKLWFLPHRGREGSWLPSRRSKMDRWGDVCPRQNLLHIKSPAIPLRQDMANVLQRGLHFTLPFGFTLEGDGGPC